jgi:hypothetical protein
MPRFVILFHQTPADAEGPSHWDFMLEAGDALRTWALENEPRVGDRIAAEALPDHRLAYLDYEGPVSGNRGTVSRWDAGEYTLEFAGDSEVRLNLQGGRLRCLATLQRDSVEDVRWYLELGD